MKILQKVVSALLSFQIAIGLPLAQLISHETKAETIGGQLPVIPMPIMDTVPSESVRSHVDFIYNRAADKPLDYIDNWHVVAPQGRTDFPNFKDADPANRRAGARDTLIEGLNTELPESTLVDLSSIEVAYDANQKRLIIGERRRGKKDGEIFRPSEIFFTDIELSTTTPFSDKFANLDDLGRVTNHPAIMLMEDVLLVSTKQGVRSFYLPLLFSGYGNSKIPSWRCMPAASDVFEGTSIEFLARFDPTKPPQDLYHFMTGKKLEPTDVFADGSLMLGVKMPDGTVRTMIYDYRLAISATFETQIPYYILELYLRNPSPELLKLVQEVWLNNSNANYLRDKITQLAALGAQGEKTSSDFLRHTLLRVSENLKGVSANTKVPDLAKQFGKNPETGVSANKFTEQRESAWQQYSVTEWHEVHNTINRVLKIAGEETAGMRKPPELNWRDTVKLANEHPDEAALRGHFQKIKAAEDLVLKRESQKLRSLLRKAYGGFGKVQAITLSAALAYSAVDNHALQNGASVWLLNVFSHMVYMIRGVPFFGQMAQIMGKPDNMETYASSYALVMVMGVIMAGLLLKPIGFWIAGAYAKAKGDKWDNVTAFFQYGLKSICYMSYSVFKFAWEKMLFQRNLYKAKRFNLPLVDVYRQDGHIMPNVSPRSAWVLPWFGNSKESGNYQPDARNTLKRDVNNMHTRKMRAMVLAAAIVSAETSGKLNGAASELDTLCSADNITACTNQTVLKGLGLDPAHLLAMLQVGDADQFYEILNKSSESPKLMSDMQQIMDAANQSLKEMGDDGVKDLNPEDIMGYYQVLRDLAHKLIRNKLRAERYENLPSGIKTGAQVALFLKDSVLGNIVSGSVWVFDAIVFGTASQEMYKLRHARLQPRDVNSANNHYQADFALSNWIYGLSSGAELHAAALGSVYQGAIFGAMVIEQIFLYGMKGSYEQIAVMGVQSPLYHPAMPLIFDSVDRTQPHGISVEAAGRQATWWSSVAASIEGIFTPESPRGILEINLKRMLAAFSGIQTNFAAGYLGRSVAVIIGSFTGAGAIAEGATAAAQADAQGAGIMASLAHGLAGMIVAIPQQFALMFGKYTVYYDTVGGIMLGYVLVWPFALSFINRAKDKAEAGLKAMRSIDDNFRNGLARQNEAMLIAAVTELQSLYQKSKMVLPADFAIPAEEMANNLGRLKEFWDYSKERVPVDTVHSESFQSFCNYVGAVVSGVFMVGANLALYKDADPSSTLAKFLAAFAINYYTVSQVMIPSWNAFLKSTGRKTTVEKYQLARTEQQARLRLGKRADGSIRCGDALEPGGN